MSPFYQFVCMLTIQNIPSASCAVQLTLNELYEKRIMFRMPVEFISAQNSYLPRNQNHICNAPKLLQQGDFHLKRLFCENINPRVPIITI